MDSNLGSAGHSCCKKKEPERGQPKRRTLRSYVVGAVAAVLACLCCFLPLIPLMLGLGSVSIFKEQLGRYHPALEAAAVVILLSACGYMWQQHRKSGKPLHSFALQVVVTIAMYGLMTFAMQSVLAPVLLGTNKTTIDGAHNHQLSK